MSDSVFTVLREFVQHPDLRESLWDIAEPSPWCVTDPDNFEDYYVDLPGRYFFPRFPDTCGKFRSLVVCQDDSNHRKATFNHCALYECPVCWNTWKSKAAYRVSDRLFQWAVKMHYDNLYHWVVSPPKDFQIENIKKIESSLKKIFKSDVNGYTLIFHAYRGICKVCNLDDEHCDCWRDPDYDQQKLMVFRYSPHWHLVSSVNFVEDITGIYETNGFVLRRISIFPIEDLFKIFSYELGHCSKLARKHAIKYWGIWSYRKIRCSESQKVIVPVYCTEKNLDHCPVHDRDIAMDEYEVIDYNDISGIDEYVDLYCSCIGLAFTTRQVNIYYDKKFIAQLRNWIHVFLQFKEKLPQFIDDVLHAYLQVNWSKGL